MGVQQANQGKPRAKSQAQSYLEDFINETDPPSLDPQIAYKNRAARANAAKTLAQLENETAQREADMTRQQQAQANAAANRKAAKDESAVARQAREVAGAVSDTAENIGGKAQDAAIGATNWVEGLPTPGSIGLLLVVIMFFIWAVVPVGANGETRFQLLWLTLTGRTTIKGEPQGNPLATSMPQGGSLPTQQTLGQTGVTQPPPGQTSTLSSNGLVNPNTGGYTPDFGATL